MKLIRFSILALVLAFSAQFAKAQVRVGANIHIGYNQPVYPAYYNAPAPVYYERPVYYNRPVYYRGGHRRVVYRNYYRPQYRSFHGRGHYGRGFEGRGRGRGHGRGW